MIINPYWFRSVLNGVFGFIGDSNMDGPATAGPATVASDTLYKWNTSTSVFDMLTTQSFADFNSNGGMQQNFATTYKAAFGSAVYGVNGAKGGAEFYPNGDTDNFYTSGTLYNAFKAKMALALSARAATRPNAIFLNLGINDYRSANTVADIQLGIDSLFSRLASDYPGVPIIYSMFGRSESGGGDQRAYQLRSYLLSVIESYPNAYLCSNGNSFNVIAGAYEADNLHYTQATCGTIGAQWTLFLQNTAISNKWARAVVCSHYDELNAVRKTLVSDFITTQYGNGNYFKMEYLTNFVTSSINNVYTDWTFLGNGSPGSTMGFTANTHMNTTGSNSSSLAINFTPSFYNRAASVNDMILGLKLKTRTTASGTAAVMIGRGDGTNFLRIAQSTTAVNYHANNSAANARNTAETALQNSTLYSVARNGTTRYLIKNKTIYDTNTLASDGAPTQAIVIGVSNNNGTLSVPINASYEYVFAAKYVSFDLDSLYDGMEYLIAHWND